MPFERAIWYPYWYELDQSIAVGEVGDFDFFKTPPDYVDADGLPVFYHGDWHERCRDAYVRQRKRILSISHHQLGQIERISAVGLDYTFTLTDGRQLGVEAEETPGLVYALSEVLSDWRVLVEMEPA